MTPCIRLRGVLFTANHLVVEFYQVAMVLIRWNLDIMYFDGKPFRFYQGSDGVNNYEDHVPILL